MLILGLIVIITLVLVMSYAIIWREPQATRSRMIPSQPTSPENESGKPKLHIPQALHRSRAKAPDGPVDAELLSTLRHLVVQDRLRRTAAINLLRERTGMNNKEARRFLDAL